MEDFYSKVDPHAQPYSRYFFCVLDNCESDCAWKGPKEALSPRPQGAGEGDLTASPNTDWFEMKMVAKGSEPGERARGEGVGQGAGNCRPLSRDHQGALLLYDHGGGNNGNGKRRKPKSRELQSELSYGRPLGGKIVSGSLWLVSIGVSWCQVLHAL